MVDRTVQDVEEQLKHKARGERVRIGLWYDCGPF